MRSWIRQVPPDEAEGRLKTLYDRIRGPRGEIDNILRVHSLRPHTLEGHMALYKGVLHHSRNALPRWFLESLGLLVSLLNRCDYCVAHHAAGLERLAGRERGRAILEALRNGAPEDVFAGRELAAMRYARILTLTPGEMRAEEVEALRDSGFDDGEILEINQVVAYFAYANRTVTGLGVTTDGDTLGLSPSGREDAEDWHHR